jgi:hypothetical protein
VHIYGRRLRGGGTNVAALAANYSFVSLYNDSTIGHILRVVEWMVDAGGTSDAVAFFIPLVTGTLVSSGIQLFSGEGLGAGSIYSGQTVVPPPFGVILSSQGVPTIGSRDMPWFYVRPGYSLVIKNDVVNTLLVASLWWEDLEPSMLDDCEAV